MTVELQESTTTLTEVADFAFSGEEVLLMRDGKAIARVTAMSEPARVTAEQAMRRFGFLKGKISVPDDIKTPFKDEIDEMFFGNPDKFKG